MSRHSSRTFSHPRRAASSTIAAGSALALVLLLALGLSLSLMGSARAAAVSVPLGTAGSYAVLAGSTVTNTGPSVINGDVGLSPGTSITGFPPGIVNGTTHAADPVALQAKADLRTAYNVAAAEQPPHPVTSDLGGQTLTKGVYNSATSLGLTGALTLNGQGDPDSVWVFQAGSTLTTASASSVNLINGADPCHVYWQIGSSATLGTASTFVGTVLALQSISVTTNVTVLGRMLARNGAVTLDTDTITVPNCTTVESPPPSTSTTSTSSPTDGATTGGPATGGPSTGGPNGGPSGGPTGPAGSNGPPGANTAPPGQITHVPSGPPETGDGGSVQHSHPWLTVSGGLALAASAVTFLWWRRESRGA